MRVNEIKYKRTVNLGNYESCSLEMTAQLSEEDRVSTSTENLMALVHKELGLKTNVKFEDIEEITDNGNIKTKDGKEIETSEDVEVTHEEKPKKKTKKKAKKATPKKDKPKKEEPKKEEPKKEEPKKEEPKKTKKSKRGEPVVYNRENAVHKQELIAFLDDEFGEGWNAGDMGPAIKETSAEMVGKDFLSPKGKLLSSFTKEFVEKVNEKAEGGL